MFILSFASDCLRFFISFGLFTETSFIKFLVLPILAQRNKKGYIFHKNNLLIFPLSSLVAGSSRKRSCKAERRKHFNLEHSFATEMGNGLSDQTSILSSLPSFQSFHVVILGLDCAGKTTVLYRLQFNEFVNTVPTKGFNTEKIKVTLGNSKTVTFHFWDVGGQEKLRPLWKSYTRCTDGIVFVVDSVDIERMEEAKTELHKITRISENQGVPVLIVANKQDLRNSLSLSEIEKLLAMGELSSSTPWHLQPTCAIIGDGLKEGLEKLHDMIIKRRKMLRQQKKKR